jgi:hypothetical protein
MRKKTSNRAYFKIVCEEDDKEDDNFESASSTNGTDIDMLTLANVR